MRQKRETLRLLLEHATDYVLPVSRNVQVLLN